MDLFFVVLSGILLFLFAFFVRVKPIWKKRYRGCDAYYYLLCAEELRRNRRIPVVLPHYYLLDNREQWYPPGFPALLSLFPEKFVKKYYWIVSPVIDCLVLILLYVLTYRITGSILTATIAGFLYSISFPVIFECESLNSRPLAALLLMITMLGLFGFVLSHGILFLIITLIVGSFLLMTHKMSAQLLYFILPIMSLVFWDSHYILMLLGIVATTFIISKGFFIKVLKGHHDILSFWNRNWKNLGANQVYSSPVYGDEDREDPKRVHQRGIKSFYRQIQYLGLNVFVVLLIFPMLHYNQLSLFHKQMLWWGILTYVLAILTMAIPRLRFLGEGAKYLRKAVFPVSYLAVTPFYYEWNVGLYFYPLLILTILAAIGITVWRARLIELSPSWSNPALEGNLASIVRYLKENDEVSAILSIPAHPMDTIAYHCRKKVLWGTHSDNFQAVEPLFPIFRRPLEFFITTYNLSHVLIDTEYVKPDLLRLSPPNMVFSAGNFQVYKVGTNKGG